MGGLASSGDQHRITGPKLRGRVATASFASVADLTGHVLGDRYRLLSVLGEGGMGTVYLAEHVTIGKQLAVKVLGLEFSQQESYRIRFLREAQSISRIAHENVVEVTDFGVAPNGSLYIVMEYLQGEGLSETLDREGALPWARAKPIVLQVCRALHAAHEKGILHRDIKPENCFRIKRGANRDFIKVLDFGLAKVVTDDPGMETSLTAVGGVIGTPEYMSPERVRGEKLDERSDVYAVGILLYEVCTGCVPFSGDHYTLVLDQQLHALPVPPRQVAPHAGISPELEAVILRALAKDRDRRYPNIRTLAETLAAVHVLTSSSAGVPVTQRRPPPPRTSTSRESTLLAIIIVLTIAVVALGGIVAAFVLGIL
jgi:serine/threonine-protein kinase